VFHIILILFRLTLCVRRVELLVSPTEDIGKILASFASVAIGECKYLCFVRVMCVKIYVLRSIL
jgi:hypothetical protein